MDKNTTASLDDGLTWLKNFLSDTRAKCGVHFAYTEPKTGRLNTFLHQPCHGALKHVSIGVNFVFTVYCPTTRAGVSRDKHKRYMEWLSNHSQWAEAFVKPFSTDKFTYDLDFMVDYGFITTGDCSTSIMVGGCIAGRAGWQTPAVVKIWDNLTSEHGINPDLAYMIGVLFQGNDDAPFRFVPHSSDHPVLSGSMPIEDVRCYLLHDPVPRRPFKQEVVYAPIFRGGWQNHKNMVNIRKYSEEVIVRNADIFDSVIREGILCPRESSFSLDKVVAVAKKEKEWWDANISTEGPLPVEPDLTDITRIIWRNFQHEKCPPYIYSDDLEYSAREAGIPDSVWRGARTKNDRYTYMRNWLLSPEGGKCVVE